MYKYMKKSKGLACITALLISCQLAACSDKSQISVSNEVKDTIASTESIVDDTAESALSNETTASVLPIYANSDDLNDAYKVTFTHDYGFDGIREKKECQFGNSHIMNSTSKVIYSFYSEYADSSYEFSVEYEESDYYLNSGVWFYSRNTAKTQYNDNLSDSFQREKANDAELFFHDFFEAINEKYYDTDADSENLWYCYSIAIENDSSFGLGNSNYYSFKIEPLGGCGNAFSFRENDTYMVINPETGCVLEPSDILGSDYANSIYTLIHDEAAKNEFIWLDCLMDCIYTDQFSWYLNSKKQFVVSFETGMVAPFSEGNVEFAIDLSDASSYLTAYGKTLTQTSTYLSHVYIDTNKPIAYYADPLYSDLIENCSAYINTSLYKGREADEFIEKNGGKEITIRHDETFIDYENTPGYNWVNDYVYCESSQYIVPQKGRLITVEIKNQNDYDLTINGVSLYLVDDDNNFLPVIFNNGSCVYQLNETAAGHGEYSFDITEDDLNYKALTTGRYKLVICADNNYIIRDLLINSELIEEDGTDGCFSRGTLGFLTDEQYESFKAVAYNEYSNMGDKGSDFEGIIFKPIKSDDNEVIFKATSLRGMDQSVFEDYSFHMTKTSSGWECDAFHYWL